MKIGVNDLVYLKVNPQQSMMVYRVEGLSALCEWGRMLNKDGEEPKINEPATHEHRKWFGLWELEVYAKYSATKTHRNGGFMWWDLEGE
jgi:hypothetical protein